MLNTIRKDHTTYLMCAILITAGLTRASGLFSSLWLDEAWRIDLSVIPLADSNSGYLRMFGQIFSYEGFLRLVRFAFGDSDLAYRVPSYIASILCIPLVFYVGKKLFGAESGLVASVLFAFSAVPTFQASEASFYSIGTALFLIYLILLLSFNEENSVAKVIVAGALCFTLLVCHLYMGVFSVVVGIAICLMNVASKRNKLIIGLAFIGVSFLLILIFIMQNKDIGVLRVRYSLYPSMVMLYNVIACIFSFSILGSERWVPQIPWMLGLPIMAFFTIFFVVVAFRNRDELKKTPWFTRLMLSVSLYIIFLMFQAIFTGQVHTRYFMVALPIVYLLIAKVISEVRPINLALLTTLLSIFFVFAWFFDNPVVKTRPNAKYIARLAEASCYSQPKSIVVVPETFEIPIYKKYLSNSSCGLLYLPSYKMYFVANNKNGLANPSEDQLKIDDNYIINSINNYESIIFIGERSKNRIETYSNVIGTDFLQVENYDVDGIKFVRYVRNSNST